MLRLIRAGFVRHFLSGFALGAVGLIAVQVSQPAEQPMFPPVEEGATPAAIS